MVGLLLTRLGMNEYFIYQHTYNTVKTVKSRTVSTEQKDSKLQLP